MGIRLHKRLHKILGYGIDLDKHRLLGFIGADMCSALAENLDNGDTTTTPGTIWGEVADERLRCAVSGALYDVLNKNLGGETFAGLKEFMKLNDISSGGYLLGTAALTEHAWNMATPEQRVHMMRRRASVRDHVRSFSSEDGVNANLLVFIPAGMEGSWSRFDDSLDHYAESLRAKELGLEEGSHERADWLDFSLYPFLGCMDSRNGRVLPGEQLSVKLQADEPEFQKEFGFGSQQEVLDSLMPLVPDCVRGLVYRSGVFSNPEWAFLQLRPVLVTHWS